MKTKLEMAHEWAMKHGDAETVGSRQNMVKYAWDYADAMQAEADKREKQNKDEFYANLADPMKKVREQEWQPDWSQAPDWANWWVAVANQSGKITGGWFYDVEPEFGESKGVSIYYSSNSNNMLTDSFGYTGDWRNSLRKRPQ